MDKKTFKRAIEKNDFTLGDSFWFHDIEFLVCDKDDEAGFYYFRVLATR